MDVISVIIPVYKTAEYLRKCVDSVISQIYTDIEVILVDDGSPDESPSICDEYAQLDSRVKVIHKENGGLSDARNAGMRAATGKYIYCIDSDDYLDDNELFSKVINIYQKEDPCIVLFGRRSLINGTIYGSTTTDYSACVGNDAEDILYNAVKADKLAISACMMFIKRDFIIDNDLFFVKGIKSEDIERGFRMFAKCPKISFYEGNPYIYLRREGSITASIDFQHLLTYSQIIEEGIRIAETCEGKVRLSLLGYAVYHASILMGHIGKAELTAEQKDGINERLKPICKGYLRKYALGNKSKLVATVYCVMGYKGTTKLLGTYLNRR